MSTEVQRMRLLQVTATLDPSFGGPPVVVNQITRGLFELGHVVDIVTLDAPAAPWLADCPAPSGPSAPPAADIATPPSPPALVETARE